MSLTDGTRAVNGLDGPDAGLTGSGRARASRYALLPLRLFLSVTFLYAGVDKLSDSDFLSPSGHGSLAQLLESARGDAAIPALINLAQHHPQGYGIAIAVAELAVGLGTLLGLWARLAAFGGALISLIFWLTVSWSSHPYYYGNDLPYLMAWTPLILAGAPVLSLDRAMALRRRRKGRHIFG